MDNKFTAKSYFTLSSWLLPIGLAFFLATVSFYNFLLFHTLAEFFAITIAILVWVVAWNMHPFTKNNYLMFLGIGYFWVAILDLMHSLNYKGMNIFIDGGANVAAQIWIGTRYFEALILLSAPFFLNHSFNRNNGFVYFGFITIAIISTVKFGFFPDGFIDGEGLTAFKVYSEYIIILLLLAAIYHLIKQKKLLDSNIVNAMVVSIIFTIAAELAFTYYISVYGLSNIVGHLLKLFSFWLIFLAVIRSTLKEPFLVMSKQASTYDAISDAIIVVDSNGIIRQVNKAAIEFSNFNSDELIGADSHKIFHPKNLDIDACPVCKSVKNNADLKGLELKINEKANWSDFSLSHIDGTSGSHGAVEVIRDITQRKVAENKIDDLDSLMNSIVENLPIMLFVKDMNDHRYVEWNKSTEEITGVLKHEILGKTDYDFWPKEQAQLFIDKDNEVIRNKKAFDIAEEFITTKYKGTRTLHTIKVPIFDQKGNPRYLLGISEDITDKLETEKMLIRSQKMQAVGQMSGGIAHDFNNQLGIILGYLELLMEQPLSESQLNWLKAVQSAGERCAELTQQLLIFSRSGKMEKDIIDVNTLVTGMEALIKRSLTPAVSIEYNLGEDLWLVNINSGGCSDAILNLILNAGDAMPDGGVVKIETKNVRLTQTEAALLPNLSKGDYIRILVSDSGIGMSPDVSEHVFEPFYTTKDLGKGTGLGLSMVYGCVQRYGGDISIETQLGEGTCFIIYLPRTFDDSTESDAPAETKSYLGGAENILVVDDEMALLEFAEHNLQSWGYKVYSASNAADALMILEKTPIDLLFSDVVMPGGINGYELAEKAIKMNSNLKVLISSGFSDKINKTTKQDGYQFKSLSKPYSRADLSMALRALLDGK